MVHILWNHSISWWFKFCWIRGLLINILYELINWVIKSYSLCWYKRKHKIRSPRSNPQKLLPTNLNDSTVYSITWLSRYLPSMCPHNMKRSGFLVGVEDWSIFLPTIFLYHLHLFTWESNMLVWLWTWILIGLILIVWLFMGTLRFTILTAIGKCCFWVFSLIGW